MTRNAWNNAAAELDIERLRKLDRSRFGGIYIPAKWRKPYKDPMIDDDPEPPRRYRVAAAVDDDDED